jgi:hypothetical protein
VAQSGGLHRQDGPVIRRIRDLEQEAPPGGRVHPEVLVTFAREGLEGRRFDAEAFPQDLPGCLLAERRRRSDPGNDLIGRLISARDPNTGEWSGPAFYTIANASLGIQAGVEKSEVVMLVMTDNGLTSLLKTQAKLGGDISIAEAS